MPGLLNKDGETNDLAMNRADTKVFPQQKTAFRFLDLPIELRRLTYVALQTADRTWANEEFEYGYHTTRGEQWFPGLGGQGQTLLALLRTCRQMHNEALSYLYDDYRLQFTLNFNDPQRSRFFDLAGKGHLSRLTWLQIDISTCNHAAADLTLYMQLFNWTREYKNLTVGVHCFCTADYEDETLNVPDSEIEVLSAVWRSIEIPSRVAVELIPIDCDEGNCKRGVAWIARLEDAEKERQDRIVKGA